jgi:hypothetical protein
VHCTPEDKCFCHLWVGDVPNSLTNRSNEVTIVVPNYQAPIQLDSSKIVASTLIIIQPSGGGFQLLGLVDSHLLEEKDLKLCRSTMSTYVKIFPPNHSDDTQSPHFSLHS